jgi:hypothetical protein
VICVNNHRQQLPQNRSEPHSSAIAQLAQFRQELKNSFTHRPDAIMSLLDSLASNTAAKSVAELSLNALFGHQYSSVYDAIDSFFTPSSAKMAAAERREKDRQLMRIITPHLSTPKQHPFWLFCLEVTPVPRPFAHTLADRTCVYQPNAIASNKPITYGHQYAALVHLPEKTSSCAPPWVVPLSVCRIQSTEKANTVQAQQINALLAEPAFASQLCVTVVDSTLSALTFLGAVKSQPNLVTIARCRSNRVFYHAPQVVKKQQGHPRWYGERFSLKDQTTWTIPDFVEQATATTRRGRQLTIEIKGWHNLLMRGTRDCPMHQTPFTLMQIVVTDTCGKLVFTRPMWLIVIGNRRHQLSPKSVWAAYHQRYDVEHFFRFGKQHLLTTAYQTPDVNHEENWWQMTQLTHVQLWLARDLADRLPRPWERYLPQFNSAQCASPSLVQRDFGRIIGAIEANMVLPKPRGKSTGRAKGKHQKQREKQKVIKKTHKPVQLAA